MKRLLVVEDGTEYEEFARVFLAAAFDVRACRSAEEALSAAREVAPDALLMDLRFERAANETLGTAIVRDKPRSARETASPARRPAAAAAGTDAVGRRPLPEGASALGAVAREPDGPAWWQMPPPSWSPFVVGQERP